jgi:hypothetical protein
MERPERPLPAREVVTGERLQALAEAILVPHALALRDAGAASKSKRAIVFDQHRDIEGDALARISDATSLAIYSPALALFQEHVWPRLTGTGYVLISHNGDAEVGADQLDWVEAAGDKLGHWFAQNLVVEHPKLSPLPIGMANAMWAHGDLDALREVAAETRGTEPSALLHARFDVSTHPDRARAWQAVEAALPGATRRPEPAPFAAYLRELASHRFCLCPRGNGVDTHRFWESQYLGVVPVVERSPHTDVWARRGVAMVALDDWDELSVERLEAEAQGTRPPLHRLALLSHHERLIRAAGDSREAQAMRR